MMERSTRVLDVPIYRRALVYAFKMITPTQPILSVNGIYGQLRKYELFDEFQQAFQQLSGKEQVQPWTAQDWITEVIDNPVVVHFLMMAQRQDHFETRMETEDV